MAEYVQKSLEEMTNEVEQLERVGLFDHAEIRKIINKRKRLQYKLQRRTRTPDDYLSFIQYENNVLSLIQIRRKETGYHLKKGEIEGAIIRRILGRFQVLCRNYPTSVELWLTYIKFVSNKMKNKSMASRLYNRMLMTVTRKPDLWVMAAKYEFENLYSIEGARHILLKGLKLNKESTLLWLEVKKRRALSKARLLAKVDMPKYVDDDMCREEVMNGKVALTVFQHAMKQHPENLEFALSFVDVVKKFDWAEDIEEAIFTLLFKDYIQHPAVWQKRCLRYVDTTATSTNTETVDMEEVDRKCCSLMRLMLSHMQTAEAWDCFLSVQRSLFNLNPTNQSLSRLVSALSLVKSKGMLSEKWALVWIDLQLGYGACDSVISLSKQMTKLHPHCEPLWYKHISHLISTATAEQTTLVTDALHRASQALPKASLGLWTMVIEWGICSLPHKELTNLFEAAVVLDADIAGVMKCHYLNWRYNRSGITKTRKLYSRLRSTPSQSLDFHRLYIRMEKAEVDPDWLVIRKAYRYLLDEFGSSSVDAWLEVIELERQSEDNHRVSVLYTQAIKTLDSSLVDDFIAKSVLHQ